MKMKMNNWCVIVLATINFTFTCNTAAAAADPEEEGFLVTKENRRILVSTENGEIVAARVGGSDSYLLHFFTMDPNSLFLPLILHSDMVFYVHTGSGKLSWTDESELKTADLRRGDVYRLKAGAVFFIQSNLETETERQRLRIISIFANSNTDEPSTGPYSSIRDMVLGFDKKVLQAAFKVPDEVIQELFNGTRPPAIIHGVSKGQERAWEMENKFLGILLGRSPSYNMFELNKKGGKLSKKLFNVFKEDKDFKNCNGWSTTVTRKKLSALKGTNIGVFMVNLTAGSMMGPHWNPEATEIAVVLQGRGMIRVVCSGNLNETGCSNMSFEVEEGDIFAVPRFHPMAQMAFNNETFVFMGFSNSAKKNHPQFLAGQASVLRTLSKDVLATSFSVENTTMDRLLASQQDSVILGCISCAEEELRIVEEEREKEREEAKEREEEEARKEEEEARKREEEAREREEEEAKRQEEERRKQEEEEEEEEAKRQEEDRRKREEEEARKREEEEAREREEEEARRQEEERKKREEEEARAREEEEARAREEEEARRREEEEAKRQEEEHKKQEEARRREEEEEKAKEMEKEREKRQAKEAREREEAEAKRQEEERKRQEEEEEEDEKEERRREEEEARQEEEERRRREVSRRKEEEEWERQRQEEEEEEEEQAGRRREREEERRGRRSEEEMAAEEERRREEEEREEEAAARQHDERERERERRASLS